MRLNLAAALLAGALPSGALAQSIATDGRFSRTQTLAGPNYTIDASLGRQVGGNLFHGFARFGLATGESATFTATGATQPIANIIGRVTGGAPSSIDGSVRSTVAGANLYLINPSGIIFGPNATISVPGSFRVSTADYLRTADGARFQATNPDGSTLSAAPPAAFGFLNVPAAKITVNGSALTGAAGQTLGLAGGPVSIDGALLTAPAGNIIVTSAAAPGEIRAARGLPASTVPTYGATDINRSGLNISDPANRGSGGQIRVRAGALNLSSGEINADNFGAGTGGRISLRSDGPMILSGDVGVHSDAQVISTGGGGEVVLRAGSLALDRAKIGSSTFGPGNGGDVNVTVQREASFQGSGQCASLPTCSGVIASSSSTGRAGDVTMVTGPLSLAGAAAIASGAEGSGKSGNVSVSSSKLTMATQSQISSNTGGSGSAGTVTVTTGALSISDPGTQIASITNGAGKAGDVSVDAATATIRNVGQINALTTGSGNAGTVRVAVAGQLSIVGPTADATELSSRFLTGIDSVANPGSTGSAGKIAASAGSLSISGFTGEISSSTLSSGNAGDVSVQVAGQLTITGPIGKFFPTGIIAESLQPPGTASTGNAGNVSVSAQSISLVAGGAIASRTTGVGSGGFVAVATPGPLLLDGMGVAGTQIAASATDPQSAAAGQVTVSAGNLTIRGGGQIASSAAGKGNGGSVGVASQGPLSLTDPGSGILALATQSATGNAGAVSVSAPSIAVLSGAAIASTTAGTGNGGDVSVSAPGGLLLDGMGIAGTQIAASALGPQSGSGGSVMLKAGSLIVQGGASIASSTLGPGKGGDVVIDVASDALLAQPGVPPQISANSRGSGDAGSIALTAVNLRMRDGASISTDAATANGGNISLRVRDLMYLVDSQITTSVKGASGNGGNILIDPRLLVLQHSSIIAQAVRGHGGDITIVADQFLPSADSIVSATSQLGISGTVELIGPRVDLNGSLVVLSSELRGAAEVLRDSCAARSALPRSSLTQAGRGGLPQDPEALIPALYFAGRSAEPEVTGASALSSTPVAQLRSVRVTAHCGT